MYIVQHKAKVKDVRVKSELKVLAETVLPQQTVYRVKDIRAKNWASDTGSDFLTWTTKKASFRKFVKKGQLGKIICLFWAIFNKKPFVRKVLKFCFV